MKVVKYGTTLIPADVLIIGGSLAGLTAAIKIKELHTELEVLVVDKEGPGWAGAVPLGAGHIVVLPPGSDLDEWVKWIADRGEGLSNNNWLYNFGGSLYESIMELFNWGLAFMKNPDGTLKMDTLPKPGMKDKMTGLVSHRVMLQLKKRALANGVKILGKVEMIDLLKKDCRIIGAVGFSILTGEFYVCEARATLLASGSARYKNRKLFTANGGEMVAAAYRAGAQHLHSEFTNFHSSCSKIGNLWYRGPGFQDSLVNAKGERIVRKYFGDISESYSKTTYAMAKEVEAGLGPIYFDASTQSQHYENKVVDTVSKWAEGQGIFFNPERIAREKVGIDLLKQKVEWIPGFLGSVGNIGVDLGCKCLGLEGLWAAGDVIKTGLAMEGATYAHDYAGWGLALAIVSGLKAAKSIAKHVIEMPEAKISAEVQEGLRETLYAPMTLEKGLEPYAAVYGIQEAIVPAKYSIIRDESRLKESLRMIEKVQGEVLPNVKVGNPHQLVKYHEAKSMALCAEMSQRAALYRTESRGSHIREDYPVKDDAIWLNWTSITKKGEDMLLSTIPMPKIKSGM